MVLFRPIFLLFSLNLLDALLTIIWVRSGVATESNQLMAGFLEVGDFTFLGAKLAMGTFAALVLLKWGDDSRIAKYGLSLALAVYISIMGIHLLTGLAAFGYVSNTIIDELGNFKESILAFAL